MDRLGVMEVFVLAVETGSFSAVGRRLGLGQPTVSKLIAQLAMHGQTSVNKIYDPAAGSGSLLLQAKKHFDDHIIEGGFFGQEINHTT